MISSTQEMHNREWTKKSDIPRDFDSTLFSMNYYVSYYALRHFYELWEFLKVMHLYIRNIGKCVII
ncbi:hypothetical protein SGA02_07860 [Staphylococcus gallinarum]|uniref:Uncharacterized protein n=1 Tax=Staphylococcus gallinarum TaxID=1293 RepID=A0ABQ0Y0P5_STAGA|nr:hypothetical protein SGA02_07860 [Staphylococcus gallinarum]